MIIIEAYEMLNDVVTAQQKKVNLVQQNPKSMPEKRNKAAATLKSPRTQAA